PVIDDLDWAILAGDRIGLLGPNGAGKSTLLKAIAGELAPQSGARLTTQGLRIGYFAQHEIDQLVAGESPLLALGPTEPTARGPDRKAQKRAEAESRQESYARRKPLNDRRLELEHEIETLALERKVLDAWLAAPLAYTEENRDALKEKLARQGELSWQLARLETEWLDV